MFRLYCIKNLFIFVKIIEKIKYYYKEIGLINIIIKILFYPLVIGRNKFLEKKIFKKKNNKDVFTEIFNTNYWNDNESKSGTGSSLKSTENIRLKLPLIIKKLNIKSIIDIPCGDFFWFSKIINILDIEYYGGDIVEKIIQSNQKFATKKIQFKQLDLINDELPYGDLLLCRDCLFHFSFDNIKKAFENLKKSKFKYILITNHDFEKTNTKNQEIKTGSFRYLDLHFPPFNFNKNYNQEILDPDYPKTHVNKKMLIYSKENFILNVENFLDSKKSNI